MEPNGPLCTHQWADLFIFPTINDNRKLIFALYFCMQALYYVREVNFTYKIERLRTKLEC